MMSRSIYFKNTSFLLTLACGTGTAFANQERDTGVTLGKFDPNVFLMEESAGITKAKVAQNLDGQPTFGGVTGLSTQLIDFSIPLINTNQDPLSQNNQPVLIVETVSGQNEICGKLRFTVTQNKMRLLPNNIKLKTATSCQYIVSNLEKTKVVNFRILLNHTFTHWCNQPNTDSEAYKTARMISETCIIEPANTTRFNLINNEMRDLSPFAGFKNLRVLNLEGNEISQLPLGILDKFTDLKTLILQNNKLTAIPLGSLDKLTKLSWLWLMDNQISDLPLGVFDKLENLDWLSLYNNRLGNLPKGLLAKLKSLESLELSNNLITIFPSDITQLNRLISVEIQSNQITEIPAGAFANFTGLSNLSLSGNRLTTLPAGLFSDLSHLYFLKLANNNISHLPKGIFSGLTNLNEIDLSGNPISQVP
jgi:Leucine-rich repeat (LRR) protein